MEGSESEAVFDAHNLNPKRFINEVLNSIDDMVDGAFEFCQQQAAELTAGGGAGTDRSEELSRGVSSLCQLTQAVLDKRMGMWEKYCLQHCFAVPEGFVLLKARDSSGDGLLLQEGLSDLPLDSQLDSLRDKLAAVGKKSAELHREILSLAKQSTLSSSYDASVAKALHLFEQSSGHEMFKEMGETTAKLHLKMEEVKMKRREDMERGRVGKINSPCKKRHVAHDLDFSSRLEDIQEAANILKST